MKLNFRSGTLTVAALMLLFSFQNCGPVEFQAGFKPTASKTLVDIDDDETSVQVTVDPTNPLVRKVCPTQPASPAPAAASQPSNSSYQYGVAVSQGGKNGSATSVVASTSFSDGGATQNHIAINQQGGTNTAVVYQQGDSNTSSVKQSGDHNTACVLQLGDDNHSTVDQTGSTNLAGVKQVGGQDSTITQNGSKTTGAGNLSTDACGCRIVDCSVDASNPVCDDE